MIMDARLQVRLRVLIPAVENAISGEAFRPLDVYRARKGLTVEIGNTDAEGRLVLADALALADEEEPELLVDMATLTGAARVALGPDLPPFFTGDDALATTSARHASAEMTLCGACRCGGPTSRCSISTSPISTSSRSGSFAGSITAALFLNRFVTAAKAWAHFDVYAWTPAASPAPTAANARAARALYALLKERYGA